MTNGATIPRLTRWLDISRITTHVSNENVSQNIVSSNLSVLPKSFRWKCIPMFIIYDNQTPSMKKIFIKFKVSGKANYRLLHGSVQIIKKTKTEKRQIQERLFS